MLQFWIFIYGWRLLYQCVSITVPMANGVDYALSRLFNFIQIGPSFHDHPSPIIFSAISHLLPSNIKYLKTHLLYALCFFCNDICLKKLVKFYNVVAIKTFFVYLSNSGMVLSVGLSNLQFVDMSSPRNIFVVGTSISIGQTLPNWINANISSINTGKTLLKNVD